MPDWYWDRKTIESKTPSIQDGMSHVTEYKHRREGARFIIKIGDELDLGYNTLATGVVFFHRFYMFHSFKEFPKYVTAACCLFLAGKVEETPKKCKDIVKVAKNSLTDEQFATFGIDPKEEVMMLEKILLQTIKFDLKVEHPYSYLLKYAKCLKGDQNKLQKMAQMSWTFCNDSLCTTLSIEWEPEIVAIAAIYLAAKLSKFKVVDWRGREPHHLRWWDLFVEDLNIKVLEDICHQILDLYSPPKEKQGLASPEQVTSIEKVPVSVHESTVPKTTTLISAVSKVGPKGSSIIFTTAMAAITSSTFSTSTVATPAVLPITIKTEKVSPNDYSSMDTFKAIFPWAVLPPNFVKQSPKTSTQLSSIPIVNLSVPPPNIPIITQKGNVQNSERDSQSPIFPVKTPLLQLPMNDQSKKSSINNPPDNSFVDKPNDDLWLEKVGSPYLKDDSVQGCMNSPNVPITHRNLEMFGHLDYRSTFHPNWNNWNNPEAWNARDNGDWDVRDMRNDNRECRQGNPMNNFRRNGSGPMRNGRRFY